MIKFTAKEARELSETPVFTSTGKVIDTIKDSARNGETKVLIPNLRLSEEQSADFVERGFQISGNIISW